jgi:hypothetical protein
MKEDEWRGMAELGIALRVFIDIALLKSDKSSQLADQRILLSKRIYDGQIA